jgi:hypothetical protein
MHDARQSFRNLITHVALAALFTLSTPLIKVAAAKPVDVALHRPIWANVTCGSTSDGSEQYLSSRFIYASSTVRAGNVETCRSTERPPSAMVDGVADSWWQSTSRTNALRVFGTRARLDAEIFLDLQQVCRTNVDIRHVMSDTESKIDDAWFTAVVLYSAECIVTLAGQ